MTISWTDAAIEAALNSFYGGIQWPEDKPRLRAALDAAVKAQGDLVVVPYKTLCETIWGVRADALEEAAAILDEEAEGGLDPRMERIASAIRALKESAHDDTNDGQPDEMQEWRDFDPDC